MSKNMDSTVRISRTITNNATLTGSSDRLPLTQRRFLPYLKKEKQLKKFTRRMEEKIESECMEAIRVSLEQERAIEIRATYKDLNLIKKWKSESSSKSAML